MPQEFLTECLRSVPVVRNENLLVGNETFDDAGVLKIRDDLALVQTIDVFTPVVDDPWWYGAIVAANSLSDVYAMGGVPVSIVSFVGFPAKLDPSVLTEMLTGAAEKVRETGAVIAGGHTIIDEELKFGMAVTGTIHPDHIVRNSTARVGDRLVLTKPLGSGLIATAIKKGLVSEELEELVTRSMAELNRAAAEAIVEVGVSAATDISGFGLLGHALEMAKGSGVTFVLSASAVPRFPGALDFYQSGMCGGTAANRRYAEPQVEFAPGVEAPEQVLLFDAQTSGGLLISDVKTIKVESNGNMVIACS